MKPFTTTRLLSGKKIAGEIALETASAVRVLSERGLQATLAFVRVGEDPSTLSYARSMEPACKEVGIRPVRVDLEQGISEGELHRQLDLLSADPAIHGIVLQRPLPAGYDNVGALQHVALSKDVDCATPENLGLLFLGRSLFLPCTAAAVIEIMAREKISPVGKHVVIIGRTNVVGRPLAHLLTQRGDQGDATVTLCHSRTRDLAEHTLRADILISAAAVPGLVKGDMIHEGTVVIDVATNTVPDARSRRGYRLVGSVVQEEALGRAAVLTPVPGGVGPVTVAMLLANTVRAALRSQAV